MDGAGTARAEDPAVPRPPARLTAKGQATRDRITGVAAGLMFERGVAGTSLEDVQRAAGISPSQIYHYFGDKKALVQAVIARQADLILAFQEPLLARLDSIEALETWRDVIVEEQHRRQFAGGCPLGALAGQVADADPQARAALADGFGRWEEAIRDGLAAMQARGALSPAADPARLALALLTALQGGLLLTQVRHDTTALATVLDAMIAQIRAATPASDPPRSRTDHDHG